MSLTKKILTFFSHVFYKVNICDAKGVVPGTSVSIDIAGKLRTALDNDVTSNRVHLALSVSGGIDF